MYLEREAAALVERARAARRRYFRELAACDFLAGRSSPFEHLGAEPC